VAIPFTTLTRAQLRGARVEMTRLVWQARSKNAIQDPWDWDSSGYMVSREYWANERREDIKVYSTSLPDRRRERKKPSTAEATALLCDSTRSASALARASRISGS